MTQTTLNICSHIIYTDSWQLWVCWSSAISRTDTFTCRLQDLGSTRWPTCRYSNNATWATAAPSLHGSRLFVNDGPHLPIMTSCNVIMVADTKHRSALRDPVCSQQVRLLLLEWPEHLLRSSYQSGSPLYALPKPSGWHALSWQNTEIRQEMNFSGI